MNICKFNLEYIYTHNFGGGGGRKKFYNKHILGKYTKSTIYYTSFSQAKSIFYHIVKCNLGRLRQAKESRLIKLKETSLPRGGRTGLRAHPVSSSLVFICEYIQTEGDNEEYLLLPLTANFPSFFSINSQRMSFIFLKIQVFNL